MFNNRTCLSSKAARAKRVEVTAARRQNAAIQLRAVDLEGAQSAPSLLFLKEPNCDGFLKHRARQLQWLVLPPAHGPVRLAISLDS